MFPLTKCYIKYIIHYDLEISRKGISKCYQNDIIQKKEGIVENAKT